MNFFWYSKNGHLIRIGSIILVSAIGYAFLEGITNLPGWLLMVLSILFDVGGIWVNFVFWQTLSYKKGFITDVTSFDFALYSGKSKKPVYIIWNDIDKLTWDKNTVLFKFKNEAELKIYKEVHGFSTLMTGIPQEIAGDEHEKIRLAFDSNYQPWASCEICGHKSVRKDQKKPECEVCYCVPWHKKMNCDKETFIREQQLEYFAISADEKVDFYKKPAEDETNFERTPGWTPLVSEHEVIEYSKND
jgi:hypothetical protein